MMKFTKFLERPHQTKARASSMSGPRPVPKVVVFDLDATIWHPEVYTLRPPAGSDESWRPRLGVDVEVFEGAQSVLEEIATTRMREGMRVAIASRSSRPEYSRCLLEQVVTSDGRSLASLCGAGGVQVYKGDKQTHLRKIAKSYGCAFEDMAFFDDARDGKFGNCARVAELGCLSTHTPRGLDGERWSACLAAYASGTRGAIVDAPAPPTRGDEATMPCVSLAMPFAALLLNGAEQGRKRVIQLYFNSRVFERSHMCQENASTLRKTLKRDDHRGVPTRTELVKPLSMGTCKTRVRYGEP